jgi:hypothetical protein
MDLFEKWDTILKENVSPTSKNSINYNAFNYENVEEVLFKDLLNKIAKYNIEELNSKNEKLVFWINLYNIAAIKLIMENYPLESIRDLSSIFKPVWNKPAINVGNKTYSLGEIEHKILRKLDEPRIHFAIVCASLSCPDLRAEAYSIERLEHQLDDQTRKFLSDSSKGLKIDKSRKIIYISQIFKWFKDDFNDVERFINIYKKIPDYKIKYLKYDWDLNIEN